MSCSNLAHGQIEKWSNIKNGQMIFFTPPLLIDNFILNVNEGQDISPTKMNDVFLFLSVVLNPCNNMTIFNLIYFTL